MCWTVSQMQAFERVRVVKLFSQSNMAAQRNADMDGTIAAVSACSSNILSLQDHIDTFPRLAATAVVAIEG
jgi:hypothetical protein